MGMAVKNNIAALKILNCMGRNESALTKNMQRISSGMRINSAADDPAAYAIAQRMDIEIRSLERAAENAQRGKSMLQTAEGAIGSTVDILRTLKEKALDAANDTNTSADRQVIQEELDELIDQINDNANVTFNGKTMLDGSMQRGIGAPVTGVYVNEMLGTGTAIGSALTDLKDRNGNDLNIKSTDTIKISFVQNGATYTTEFKVSSSTTLESLFQSAGAAAGGGGFSALQPGNASSFIGVDATGTSVYTADGQTAFSVASSGSGLEDCVAGFSIGVTGADGNVKKSINTVLDAFSRVIQPAAPSNENAAFFQIGSKSNQAIRFGIPDMRAAALGLQGTDPITGNVKNIDLTTKEHALAAIDALDEAIESALRTQASFGAAQSRLDYTVENLTTSIENLTAAVSTIRDANIAKEMTEFTKNNIIMQAAQAMLAQANQSSQGILSLLQ